MWNDYGTEGKYGINSPEDLKTRFEAFLLLYKSLTPAIEKVAGRELSSDNCSLKSIDADGTIRVISGSTEWVFDLQELFRRRESDEMEGSHPN